LEDSISRADNVEGLASFFREDSEAQERVKTTDTTPMRFKMVFFEITGEIIGEIIRPHPLQKKTQSAFISSPAGFDSFLRNATGLRADGHCFTITFSPLLAPMIALFMQPVLDSSALVNKL